MAAMYNYAYDNEPVASVTIEPPQYEDLNHITRTMKPPEDEMHRKTTSTVSKPPSPYTDLSNTQTTGSTVPKTTPNHSVCRLFMMFVLTFVIGCAVGGVVMYLWTRQTSSQGITSEVLSDSTTTAKNSDTLTPSSTSPTSTSPTFTSPKYTSLKSTSPKSASPTVDDLGFPKDCQEVKNRGNVASGQYMISPQDDEAPFRVYCDMETDGGGWTVFQRREDGSIDFYLGWSEYEDGFGNVNSEHWLGNTNIHRITAQGHYELRIDMTDSESNTAFAKYDNFRVGNAGTNYKLILGSYTGDAGDSLSAHNNHFFSTKDRDNDAHDGANCATSYKGGWWYEACHNSNLNGLYLGGPHESYADGINWHAWKGYHNSLTRVEMRIRLAP